MTEEAKPVELSLDDVFKGPRMPVLHVEVVEATELEIAAMIVLLKARSKHFPLPLEVQAFPHSPQKGWRMAALNAIRQNKVEQAKGRPTVL